MHGKESKQLSLLGIVTYRVPFSITCNYACAADWFFASSCFTQNCRDLS